MYAFAHGAVGFLLGLLTGNIYWAMFLGALSHFLLDYIPHFQFKWQNKNRIPVLATISVALLTVTIFLYLFSVVPAKYTYICWAGIIFSWIPDLPDIIHLVWNIRAKKKHQNVFQRYLITYWKWHDKLNTHMKRKHGIVIEALITLVSILMVTLMVR